MARPIFCCSHLDLQPRSAVRTPSQVKLWHFAWAVAMPNPDLTSTRPTPSRFSFSSPTSSPPSSPLSEGVLASLIYNAPYAIQLENWTSGDKAPARFFVPHPERIGAYFEVDKEQVWDDFAWSWEHIKIFCEHRESFYVVKMLGRNDGGSETSPCARMKEDKRLIIEDRDEEVDNAIGKIDWKEFHRKSRRRVPKRKRPQEVEDDEYILVDLQRKLCKVDG